MTTEDFKIGVLAIRGLGERGLSLLEFLTQTEGETPEMDNLFAERVAKLCSTWHLASEEARNELSIIYLERMDSAQIDEEKIKRARAAISRAVTPIVRRSGETYESIEEGFLKIAEEAGKRREARSADEEDLPLLEEASQIAPWLFEEDRES